MLSSLANVLSNSLFAGKTLKPKPTPPCDPLKAGMAGAGPPPSPATIKGFNPQPDPPGKDPGAGSIIIIGGRVARATPRLDASDIHQLGGPDTMPAAKAVEMGVAKQPLGLAAKVIAAAQSLIQGLKAH